MGVSSGRCDLVAKMDRDLLLLTRIGLVRGTVRRVHGVPDRTQFSFDVDRDVSYARRIVGR